MKKIIYNGDVTPCNVNIFKDIVKGWIRGEIREMSDRYAEKLLKDNENFSLVVEKVKVEKVKEEESKTLTKKQVYDLTKEEQVNKLKELGQTDEEIKELKYEGERVKKILELEGEK